MKILFCKQNNVEKLVVVEIWKIDVLGIGKLKCFNLKAGVVEIFLITKKYKQQSLEMNQQYMK